ncbi:terpenoid cyclases/protein prenyltransferase alpha-alpha toroid, partial [Phakopsora pachyrhizi]
STVFGTALNYVACRLLSVDAEHPMLAWSQATLHSLGKQGYWFLTWGKVCLSLLNVYNREGVDPITPKIWLLPDVLPFLPWRWWVHSWQVYLPISYISGKRLRVELNPLLSLLCEKLYTQPYSSINWPSQHNSVLSEDLYCPHHPVADALFWILGKWE